MRLAASSSSGTDAAPALVMINILWGIALIFVVLWLFGFALHVGGGLIHLLLVVALITVVVRVVMGSGSSPA